MNLAHLVLDRHARSQSNTLILGSIGFGKSKFLEYLMRQDLGSRQPFCLIDFHGTLYDKVKSWCALNSYDDRRVVLIDPAGCYLKGFNPFAKQPGLDVGVQSTGMVEALLRIWGLESPDSYPVIYKLTKLLFAVMIEHNLPLQEAVLLFTNRSRFSEKANQLSDPISRAMWSDLANLTQAEWSRQATPTLNKLFRIVQSKALQRMLCVQEPGYNLSLTFADTILINLATSGSLDADAARTIGALLLNCFYHAAKHRKAAAGKDPSPYYVYIDEWWLVPTPDIGRILAETRKFGLLLVLANQDLSQLQASFGAQFTQTLLTLCQVQCCFGGLNHSDSNRLFREWGLQAEDIQELRTRECYVKLPRRAASRVMVPDIPDRFLRPGRLAEFERRIGIRTRALPAEEVNRLLAAGGEKPKGAIKDEDFLV